MSFVVKEGEGINSYGNNRLILTKRYEDIT